MTYADLINKSVGRYLRIDLTDAEPLLVKVVSVQKDFFWAEVENKDRLAIQFINVVTIKDVTDNPGYQTW